MTNPQALSGLDTNQLLQILLQLLSALLAKNSPSQKSDAGCGGLGVGPGNPIGCADGAQVLLFASMPTEGSVLPVFTAGVGWSWANAGPVIGPGATIKPPEPQPEV